MKHRVGFNRLGRSSAHRRAMTRNMLTSLFRHESIRTTKAKALAVRRTAEKMITRSKIDSVHNRRMIARDIYDKAVVAKMFTEIGPRFKERPGGYTRVLKLGPRPSDAAEMVILELVKEEIPTKTAPAKKRASKEKGAPAAAKPAVEPKREASEPAAVEADAEVTTDASPTESVAEGETEE